MKFSLGISNYQSCDMSSDHQLERSAFKNNSDHGVIIIFNNLYSYSSLVGLDILYGR